MPTPNKSKPNKCKRKPNRLIAEKSPYLLQHAFNPVDWYPWGSEAFDKARKENKPIFLSIGYSTCHWCHVMEKESFEDPEIASMMNEAFICIKVDREERPDIDRIYMTVCQMMTGSGGWPLTIIMTPDKKPFFAATYIPRPSRLGRLGMMELIPRIQELWKSKKGEVMSSAEQITQHLTQISIHAAGEPLGEAALEMAYRRLSRVFDERYGGFGRAPKFPTPHNLTFLLRYWKRTGEQKALRMVEKTLQSMRLGGIYDHVGFGFHRYSTDSRWLLPHFEKMLYDQALLVMAYTEAYQATRKEEYRHTVREILDYVMRDMTAPEGGFYSAEDAESEGEEGKFYLWTEEEIRQLLPGEESDLIVRIFNIEKDGNFAEEATGRRTGSNILYLRKSLHETASDMKISPEELERDFQKARQKLFAARHKRVHPHKDDKILTDWNGLMIAALARASSAFDEPQYAEATRRAADFILARMRDSKGKLYHRYRDGETAIPAYLDDY
ncbi:MAG: thioredoxin domain-containing protein, partial [Candidatus Aminicenantes bacterium]|nr:thioredoxin domain-containing protein [Candidatus Aminicenantes bacterium]